MPRYLRMALPLIALFMPWSSLAANADDELPLLTDMEEYAVYIAVLFPQQQGKDTAGMPSLPPITRLDGITGKNYRLYYLAGDHGRLKQGVDSGIINSYNRNNATPLRLDEKILQSMAPDGHRVNLVANDSAPAGREDIATPGGITYLSRPGYNSDRSGAIVQIRHVADYEMGVGYLVHLERKMPDGHWQITGSDLTRMY